MTREELLLEALESLKRLLPYVEQDAEDIYKLGDQDEQDSVSATIQRAQQTLERAAKPPDDDDICPERDGQRHEPDWNTVKVESDGGEFYLDVSCRLCGRSGCIGTEKTLASGINW